MRKPALSNEMEKLKNRILTFILPDDDPSEVRWREGYNTGIRHAAIMVQTEMAIIDAQSKLKAKK